MADRCWAWRAGMLAGGIIAAPLAAVAAPDEAPPPAAAPAQSDSASAPSSPFGNWAAHVQATDVLQYVPDFRSPYVGANSLHPAETANTVNASLTVGVRPW